MESFRLKNIIILILALMNLCLLGLLGVRLTTGYSAQAEARQQMVQLFAAEGVSLDDGIIPGATPPAGLTLSRDRTRMRSWPAFSWEMSWSCLMVAAASPPIKAKTAAPSSGPTAPLTW